MMNITKKYDCDFQFKIVLVGDSGVGKSCILIRFADDIFSDSYISTIGVDFRFRTIRHERRIVKLQIWDTAGQERYRTITSAYYRGADGVIIVYDVTNLESFSHVSDWILEIQRMIPTESCVVLVGNKCDLPNRVVHTEVAEKLANKLGILFFESSAKESLNIDVIFHKLSSILVQNRIAKQLEVRNTLPCDESSSMISLSKYQQQKAFAGCC